MVEQRTATELALEESEARNRFGPPPAEVQTEVQFWRWWLVCLNREHMEARELAVKKLADIEALKPIRPIFNQKTPQEALLEEDFKRMVGEGQRQLHSARMMEHWAKQEALRPPQEKELIWIDEIPDAPLEEYSIDKTGNVGKIKKEPKT